MAEAPGFVGASVAGSSQLAVVERYYLSEEASTNPGWGWLVRRAGTWRAAGPAHRLDSAGQPPGVGQRAAEQELDLSVRAAQLVGGPPCQRIMNGRVEPEQDAFALAHADTVPSATGRGIPY